MPSPVSATTHVHTRSSASVVWIGRVDAMRSGVWMCDGAWNHTDRVCSIPSPSLPLLPSSLAHASLHSPPRVIVPLLLHPFSRECIAQGCEWVWSDEVVEWVVDEGGWNEWMALCGCDRIRTILPRVLACTSVWICTMVCGGWWIVCGWSGG